MTRVLKNSVYRLVKKVAGARRARNRRAEAYLSSTSERDGSEREGIPLRSSATILNALPVAGYWQVGLFHQPVTAKTLEVPNG